MNQENLREKQELNKSAIDLYIKDNFTIQNLSKNTGKSTTEIYSFFPNKMAVLKFYYPSLVLQYRAMVKDIEDFETYSIGEKLSNFIFTMFDMMEEQREFVDRTFEAWELKPFERTEFHKEVQRIFKDMFSADSRIALSASFLMGNYFYSFLQTEYLYLIRFWLNDDSENYERTMALTDKFTGFLEEIAYTKIVDRGFDLVRFAISSTGMSSKIPLFGSWISRWVEETKEEEAEEVENLK